MINPGKGQGDGLGGKQDAARPPPRLWKRFDYFLRRPRIASSAPETSARAAAPEAGLISGAIGGPAITELARPTKRSKIPTNFILINVLNPWTISSAFRASPAPRQKSAPVQ